MRFRLFLALALAASALFVPAIASAELGPGGTFQDDNGNTHEGMIEAIFEADVTAGCHPSGILYCPGLDVTRGQMASFLARAFGFPDATEDYFPDDDGSTHEANINKIAEAGVTLGFPDGTYQPDGTVTREQMGSFIARAMGLVPIPGDMFDDVDGTHEGNVNTIADAGITLGCNPEGTLFCPKDDVRRDQMASFIGRARGLVPEVVPPPSTPELQLISSSLNGALYATAPAGDARLFVVEKEGYISIFENDAEKGSKFLNIASDVSGGGEQGLLGLAFHPDYGSNGQFYVYYTDTSGDTIVSEWTVSGDPDLADHGSERIILTIEQPFANHNGGMIDFDADGYLWIGLGDGGSGGDPQNHGENPTTLLGSMLRIDVDTDDFPGDPDRNYGIPITNPFVGSAAGADEVWAYGLRNPWRWSFDRVDGNIYIGDVGETAWEEISVAGVDEAGINYGWDILEGSSCYEPAFGCVSTGTRLPAVEYPNPTSGLAAVVGGFVYRGTLMPDLQGVYFYSDAHGFWVRSFRYYEGEVLLEQDWPDLAIPNVWGFGQDDAGELYILDNDDLWKIVP